MIEGKPSNPKDSLGIRKAGLHCVPCQPLYELGLAMLEGGRKYGAHNYRAIGVRASVYYDAVLRHIMAWWEGEDIDPDSGVAHIVKAIACLFVMRDAELIGKYEDDRPVKHVKGLDLDELNKKAAALILKYPKCAAPFIEVAKHEEECLWGDGGKFKSSEMFEKSCLYCKHNGTSWDNVPPCRGCFGEESHPHWELKDEK